jgi:hypothetical protein
MRWLRWCPGLRFESRDADAMTAAQPTRLLCRFSSSRIRRTLGPFLFSLLIPLPVATLAVAQQWDDDRPRGGGVVREELAPSPGSEERARGVEREELDPVLATDGSGLPYELWGGLSAEQFAQHIAALSLPPKSPALHALWRRLIASDTGPGAGSVSSARFTALRVEALDQSGLIDDAAALLAKDPAAGNDPVLAALTARSEIGLGNLERGCEIAKGLLPVQSQLPKPMLSDTLLINGYCAAARGDSDGASLQANLMREQDLPGLVGADFLDSAAAGLVPEIPSGLKLSLLDYRIASLRGQPDTAKLLAAASPALLAGLAQDPRTAPDLRLVAGEAAVVINALPAGDLAQLYRASGAGGDAGTIERAGLFKSAERERTPLRKARHIRAYLDEARRVGLYWPALQLMERPTQELEPVPEIGWFAETAIEINLAAGNYEGVRQWARLGPSLGAGDGPGSPPLSHWIALADIADPSRGADRGRSLDALTPLAYSGRFDAGLLHRLATVLDALDINVPMPLWELISRAPQPAGGHLPDTGVLSELADASKKKEFGRTVLLVLRTIGPAGAEGAHMIALGDSLRALKRAGLDAEARQLALEGLFGAWPRSVSQ